ncbi:hypothetical protein HNQ40_003206 [Algisphaera agarilytica]|uniref:Uncharacterized protein n=1 Tax=Algisphaera agarilytica TaxID=1385975 RepID=A0A7X0LLE1_9BACT|nr:hypothetical protein [Algisphaera agarilytica]
MTEAQEETSWHVEPTEDLRFSRFLVWSAHD